MRKRHFDGTDFTVPRPRERILPTNDFYELRAILKKLIHAQQATIRKMRLRDPVVKSLNVLLAVDPRRQTKTGFTKFMNGERNSFSLPEWRICCLHLGASYEDTLKGIEILTGVSMTHAEWAALMEHARKEWEKLPKKHGADVNKEREKFVMRALKNSLASSK